MSTDKRKPVPSPKHTLDDVLKTLQDLVRNELAEEHLARERPVRTAGATHNDDANDADEHGIAAPVDIGAASLAAQTDIGASNEAHSASGSSHAERSLSDDTAMAPADIRAELSTLFDDDEPPTAYANADIDTESAATDEAHVEDADLSNVNTLDETGAPTQGGPEQTSINWDDIPVLNDIVALPVQTEASSPNARAVAVRVVAKLNIELRKAGNTPLDPVIIDRLEHLLREALEASANPTEQ